MNLTIKKPTFPSSKASICPAWRMLPPWVSLLPITEWPMGHTSITHLPTELPAHHDVLHFSKPTLCSEKEDCCLGCPTDPPVPALVPHLELFPQTPQLQLNTIHQPGVLPCTAGETTGSQEDRTSFSSFLPQKQFLRVGRWERELPLCLRYLLLSSFTSQQEWWLY